MRIVRATDRPLEPASHEDAHRPGVWKRVLARRDDLLDGRVQMVNWAILPAGSRFAAHYHEDMQELFLIVRGKVDMIARPVGAGNARDCDSVQCVRLGPGDLAIVDPKELHQMYNAGDEDAEYAVMGISLGQGGRTVVVHDPPEFLEP